MNMTMTRAVCSILGVTIASLAAGAWPAEAQYVRYSPPETAIGENYHVEMAYGLWKPSPDVQISSGSLGIPGAGSTIDLVNDFGIQQKKLGEFRLVLKPARKHKIRIGYTPIKYSVDDAILHRDIVFRGRTFNVGLPVNAQATWRAWRFGYEYDFVSADRGFLGAVLEAKYTNADANVASPVATESASAKAPIPAVGVIGRGYVARMVSATAEFTFFRLRNGDTDKYKGSYYDFDLYGTVNITNYVGAQVGYRSLDVSYTVKTDSGTVTLRGPYVMGVLRF